eukprot:6176236-Pleurochrysis_carterae.AAC.4
MLRAAKQVRRTWPNMSDIASNATSWISRSNRTMAAPDARTQRDAEANEVANMRAHRSQQISIDSRVGRVGCVRLLVR